MPINVKGKKPAHAGAPKTQPPTPSEKAPETADLSGLGDTPQETKPPAEQKAPAPQHAQEVEPDELPSISSEVPKAPGSQTKAAFLMTGAEAKEEVDQIQAMAKLRGKLRGGHRKFWLEPGQFANLYFLDGKLGEDEMFDTPMVPIHTLQIGGTLYDFVCMQRTEGECLACASNSDYSTPKTVQLFTVINTMPYTIQRGPRKGTTLPARLQMLAAPLRMRTKLIDRAKMRNNRLAGLMFRFRRDTKQDMNVGGDVEFMQEVPMKSVLAKYPKLGTTYDAKGESQDGPTTVLDYAYSYPVITNAELAQLRPDLAGHSYNMIGGGAASGSPYTNDPTAEIDDEVPF